MKRTKLRAENTLSRGLKNSSTQTDNFDNQIEIAKLEEQIRLLQLEVNVLRRHSELNKPNNVENHRSVSLTPNATSKINTEKKLCNCKGNCSSRICGCVKKNHSCNPSCKCDGKLCQNQKSENKQENKENINVTNVTLRNQRKKNEDVRNRNKRLISTDTTDNYEVFEEELEIKEQDEKEENIPKQQELAERVFKPRHQLSRTPPKNLEKLLEKSGHHLSPLANLKKLEQPSCSLSGITKNLEKQFEKPIFQVTNTSQTLSRNLQEPSEKPRSQLLNVESIPSHSKSIQEMMNKSPFEFKDIKEETVEWQEHTAQLIACQKCKRTFLPDRIKKHEACCKKI